MPLQRQLATQLSSVQPLPLVVPGGGMCANEEELREIAENGLKLSPVTQCLIERSIAGFREKSSTKSCATQADNALVVCNMENFDPVGIHTGDSIVFAPANHVRL